MNIKASRLRQIIFVICLCIYLAAGIKTQVLFITSRPVYDTLLEDFGFYEQALDNAFTGKGPYFIRSIGQGYLYPPPALFIVEAFHSIKSFYLKFLVYSAFNIVLMVLIVYGIARYYGYSAKKIWYWFVFCLGFAPFLELLHIGQINVMTLFGIFMLFFWLDSSYILSGFGLSVAILTKVSPIVFFGYLVITKKFKSIVATMVWMVIIIVLSIIRYGISTVLIYPEVLQWLSKQFPINYNSQSLVSKIVMVFGFPFHNYEIQVFQRVLILYILFVFITSSFFTIKGKQSKEPLFIIIAFGMTILPNVMWYHHYVFILLPILIWMGWKRLDTRIVTWCLIGLTITQIDRFSLTGGLLIHIFIHISMLSILLWQAQKFFSQRKTQNIMLS
jgi:alpha-1,2-mannosyltransferase